jgi:hypothetical protein
MCVCVDATSMLHVCVLMQSSVTYSYIRRCVCFEILCHLSVYARGSIDAACVCVRVCVCACSCSPLSRTWQYERESIDSWTHVCVSFMQCVYVRVCVFMQCVRMNEHTHAHTHCAQAGTHTHTRTRKRIDRCCKCVCVDAIDSWCNRLHTHDRSCMCVFTACVCWCVDCMLMQSIASTTHTTHTLAALYRIRRHTPFDRNRIHTVWVSFSTLLILYSYFTSYFTHTWLILYIPDVYSMNTHTHTHTHTRARTHTHTQLSLSHTHTHTHTHTH